ncbi:MAG: CBS domain-containing protein [Burkholderiaceae bacterium]|nr:CBS domain-containing protein [Burkholderiaceae bacterium]
MLLVYGPLGRSSWSGQDLLAPVPPARAVERSRPAEPLARGIDEPPTPPSRTSALATTYGAFDEADASRPRRLQQAAQVMLRPVLTVGLQTEVPDIWQLLQRHGVGQLVACDVQGVPVGLVLRSDLVGPAWPDWFGRLAAGSDEGHQDTHAWTLALQRAAGDWRTRARLRAADLLRSPVPAARPDTSLRRIAAVLARTGMAGLPVVEEGDRLVGWVGRRELLRAVATDPPLDLWG